MKRILIILVVMFLLLSSAYLLFRNETSRAPFLEVTNDQPSPSQSVEKLAVLARNLNIPWSIVFLPDGSALFTQRPGQIRGLDKDGKVTSLKIQIPDVKHVGEGGLLGIAVDPKFEDNRFIYVYFTFSSDGSNTLNRVVRYKFENNQISSGKVLVGKIPGASNHNGGRLKFGPDGFLYITTGDAQKPSQSQDKNSLAGKILRVDREGKSAAGNPFDNLVYSYGHRNLQGLAWNSKDMLYATEHGPLAHDEVNRIIQGGNYGWPEIQGTQTRSGMISPLRESGLSTWAPSGAAFYNTRFFFAGLRGTAVFEAKFEGESVDLKEHFKGEFGRIRDVVLGPDNMIYILTNNTDGRGNPGPEDDRIIKIDPTKL